MRRKPISSIALATVAVADLLSAARGRPAGPDADAPKANKEVCKPVRGKGKATLKGRITVQCDPPADWSGTEGWRLGDNKQVGNVLVFLRPEKDQYFPIDKKQLDEAKRDPVEIHTTNVGFRPHTAVCFLSYPDPTDPRKRLPSGQTCTAVNSDMVTHNVAWHSFLEPKNIQGANEILTVGMKMAISPRPEVLRIYLRDALFPHGRVAFVWFFDHPYAAVSRSDTAPRPQRVKRDDPLFGTYEIKDVPSEVKVRVSAWHEKVGWLTKGGRNGEELDLKAGENVKDFKLVPGDD